MEAVKAVVKDPDYSDEALEARAFLAGTIKLSAFQFFELPIDKIRDAVEVLFQNALSRPPVWNAAGSLGYQQLSKGLLSADHRLSYEDQPSEATKEAIIKCAAIQRWSMGYALPVGMRNNLMAYQDVYDLL